MKRAFLLILLSVAIACSSEQPRPNEDQLALQDMEMYAFLHYSLNTYTDQEWGYGDEDPALFTPSHLDTRQWVRTCKAAGMRGIIFTAKHHCGFCMWPSEYTEFSVKHSPWRDGQGDVVRELADACREYGLKFAVYLSPWDRNHPEYGRPEYVQYFRNQLRELLTNYGDIFEVWFDGANSTLLLNFPVDKDGLIHPADSIRGAEFYGMVKEIFEHPLESRLMVAGRRCTLRFVGGPTEFNRLMLSEDIRRRQRVKAFKVEALVDGEWVELHDTLSEEPERSMTTIGRKRILCFPTTRTDEVRVTILDSKDAPVISSLSAYLAPDLG